MEDWFKSNPPNNANTNAEWESKEFKEITAITPLNDWLKKYKENVEQCQMFFNQHSEDCLKILLNNYNRENNEKITPAAGKFLDSYMEFFSLKNDIDLTLYQKLLTDIYKRHFSLYPDRSAGKKGSKHAVFDVTLPPKKSPLTPPHCAFIVNVPVPVLDSYQEGGDRDPLKIVEMFVLAAEKSFPSIPTKDFLYIVIGLNLLDDYNDLFISTEKNIQKLQELADQWNKKIQDQGYPAKVVPILWGNVGPNEEKDFFELKDINEKLKVEEMRNLKKSMKFRWNMNLPQPSFPFATIRSFLIDCKPSQAALKVFKEHPHDVYFVTVDADILSVPDDYFEVLCKNVENKPAEELVVRLGGSFCFTEGDMQRNIMKYKDIYHLLSEDVNASVQLTEIIHKLDIKTRSIFHRLSSETDLADIQSLAYFSEGNSCLSNKALEHCKHTCKAKMGKLQKIKLTQQMRNSNLDLPDYSDSFSNSIRQKRNWDSDYQSQKITQVFLDEEASITLSSRHDIVIVKNKKIVHVGKVKCSDEHPLATLKGLLYTLDNIHNHQTRLSQLNMRFGSSMKAGNKVKEAFYNAVINQKDKFPLVYSLMEPTKAKDKEKREKEQVRREERKKKFDESYESIQDVDNSTHLSENDMSSIIEDFKDLEISVPASYKKHEDDLYRLCAKLIDEMEVALEEFLRDVKNIVKTFSISPVGTNISATENEAKKKINDDPVIGKNENSLQKDSSNNLGDANYSGAPVASSTPIKPPKKQKNKE